MNTQIKHLYGTKGNPDIPNKWDVLLITKKKYIVTKIAEAQDDDSMVEIHLKPLTWFWRIALWLKNCLS